MAISDAIRTRQLAKRFGDTPALRGLDLAVPEGVVYGFLGPNGAGKTTTLRVLAGLLHATEGEATVLGRDVRRHKREVQRRIGYLPGEAHLYGDLTGAQNLALLGRLHPSPPARRSELLERFGLEPDVLGRSVSSYSRGMLQMLAIVATFQHDPPVYLLDEPTTGLDPVMRARLVELLEDEARRGKTVLLSSHVVSEVERACDRVGMIRSGRLISEGALAEVHARSLRRLDVVFAAPVTIDWPSLAGVVAVEGTARHHLVSFRGGPGAVLERLRGQPIEDLTLRSASLEEAFLELYEDEGD